MSVKKHCAEPYLSQLLRGTKTIEGRVRKGDWQEIRKGDTIEFYNENRKGLFRVVDVTYACDFGALFEIFREQLLPSVESRAEAVKIYAQWFSCRDIQEYGVVGIHLEKIPT
jgi:ASC-1-like (ASCH) protein